MGFEPTTFEIVRQEPLPQTPLLVIIKVSLYFKDKIKNTGTGTLDTVYYLEPLTT